MDVKTFKAEVRSIFRAAQAVDKKVGELRVRRARNVYAGITEGMVGANGAYPTQKAYAEALGVKESNMVSLKRLGKALVVIGCDPSDPLWGRLSDKAGTKEVGKAIDAENATPESVYAVLTETFGPDGRRISGGTGQGSDANNGSGDTPVSGAVAKMDKGLALVRDAIKEGLPEEATRTLLNALANIAAEAQEAARQSA